MWLTNTHTYIHIAAITYTDFQCGNSSIVDIITKCALAPHLNPHIVLYFQSTLFHFTFFFVPPTFYHFAFYFILLCEYVCVCAFYFISSFAWFASSSSSKMNINSFQFNFWWNIENLHINGALNFNY